MIIVKFLRFLDKNIHKKRIIKSLQNSSIETIIDVGAHKGEFIASVLKINSVNKIFGFEPQKKIFNILSKKFLYNKKIYLKNIAIGKRKENKIMKINKLSETSTLSDINNNSLFFKIKNLLLFKKNSIISKQKVYVNTLDSFFKKKFLINNNILLKIDTEGYELNVLKGFKKKLCNVKYILIENQFSYMYKNNNFQKCHIYLINKKFKLLKRFIFPTLHYEDRLYLNENYKK